MKRLSLVLGLATAGVAAGASASVLTVGGGYARSCFEAADSKGVPRNSIENCNRALTEEALSDGDRVASHVNRGILLLRQSRLAEADSDFDAALAMDAGQAEAWLNKAILKVRYERSSDALPLVAKALENHTRRPALAYFVRGVANEDTGNISAAYHDLQLARSLDPKWDEPAIELRRYQVRRP
jgi:tetratricopeptide (TPR) repeat protein